MAEKELKEGTLGFLVKDGKVWLAIKARHIGAGRWNGYGGGIESGDKNLEDCLKREIRDESGVEISPNGFEPVAIIDFHNTKTDGRIFVAKIHVYLVRNWKGDPIETEEMKSPILFDFKDLPLDRMMPADKYWLPLILEGKKLLAEFHYGPMQLELLREGKIQIVTALPGENTREFKLH